MKKYFLVSFMALALFAQGQCYSISAISYSPASYTGTTISLGDNVFSPMIPIGFSFCFYGASYDSLTIFSNGVISFSSGLANTTMNVWGQPLSTLPNPYWPGGPKNSIMFPWQDLDPSQGGTIAYSMIGISPNRIFIVSFDNVPMDSCSKFFKGQLKLFETTNIIETHIANKDTCLNWGGYAIHGLESAVASFTVTATIVSGRNFPSQWTTTNEGIKFTPICNVCTGMSVNENNQNNNFSIYPNPFSTQTVLHTDIPLKNATLTVYNCFGQQVKQFVIRNSSSFVISRDCLPSGLYFIRLTEENKIYTDKLVITDK